MLPKKKKKKNPIHFQINTNIIVFEKKKINQEEDKLIYSHMTSFLIILLIFPI